MKEKRLLMGRRFSFFSRKYERYKAKKSYNIYFRIYMRVWDYEFVNAKG
jgi:hypothetical protein